MTSSSILPPKAPTLISPGTSTAAGETINTLTPTLKWSASTGADYYSLTIRKYPYGLTDIVYDNQKVDGTSQVVPGTKLVSGQKYRWFMRAHNSAGWSPVSSTLYFMTSSSTVPDAPIPTSPGTNTQPGKTTSLTPKLMWNPSFGANYYTLAISKYPFGAANIVYNAKQTIGTSVTVPQNVLVQGYVYRWNMRAHNSAGASPLSSTLYFNTKSSSGYFWPTGSDYNGSRLGFGLPNPDFNNQLHLGQDFQAPEGDNVYAIADGKIIEADFHVPKYGGLTKPGGAIKILHTAPDGKQFIALYGHIKGFTEVGYNQVQKPEVHKGDIIAKIGPYDGIKHLHFGINVTQKDPYTKWPGYAWKITTWTNPMVFLRSS
jgi:murein DD-endopeptidase MepM/ murein hydrolase activator NlpD